MATHEDIAAFVSTAGGGGVGAVAALAVRPPQTAREGAWRALAGVATSLCLTGWVCEYLGVPSDEYYKVVTVGVVVGFCGWHLLTILMVVLDSLLETARKERLGFVVALIKLLRGQVPPPPQPPAKEDPS